MNNAELIVATLRKAGITHDFGIPSGNVLPLMEAMRESRPVVATAVGGVPEMVDDGISGFVVPRARSDEMAAAVVQMFTPPERAIEMGTAGRRVALERFDIPRIAERLEQLYREVSRDR